MAKRPKNTTTVVVDQRAIAMGEKLKKMRIEKGYVSAEFFAWEHKIPRVTYARLEAGTNFTISTLLKALDAHSISLAEFFKDME